MDSEALPPNIFQVPWWYPAPDEKQQVEFLNSLFITWK